MKKILVKTEASYLLSGYGIYGKNILTKLYKRPDFEVAELAVYASNNNPELRKIPWKVYPNEPSSEEEKRVYDSNPYNVFGRFKFEQTCLDFRPDYVLSFADFWMDSFIHSSPFRPYYNWILMPTVDAEQQKEEWLEVYSETDAILTYQDWSAEILKKEIGKKINYIGSAPPAASEEFQPLSNREEIKIGLGINPKDIVIGTVMRNQRRKLFPDLFEGFREFLDKSGRDDVVLYCHTSYPDNGWDFPFLLKKYGLGHKVLFTYVCQAEDNGVGCGAIFASKFQDAVTACPRCKRLSAGLSTVRKGVPNKALAGIYNIMDLYVQYANCLTPEQEILTESGWKEIQNVNIGESVYTHKGRYRKVKDKFIHKNNNRVKKIKVWGDCDSLELTNEHPIYCITSEQLPKSRSVREYVGDFIRQNKDIPTPTWTEAKNLKNGDLIAYKIDFTEKDISTIDLSKLCDENYLVTNQSYKHKNSTVEHKRYLKTDNDFCRWMGLFVADGNCNLDKNNGSIRITSNILELNNHDLCDYIMAKYGNLVTKSDLNRNAQTHEIYNKIFTTFLKRNCYSNKQKKLPDWCLILPINKQKEILRGLFMGDGHYIEKLNTSIYNTISYKLSLQIKELCRRIGLTYNVRKVIKNGNRKPQYRFEVSGDIKSGIFNTDRTSTRSLNYNGYYYYQIKSITNIDYEGLVYNIEVEEDNSYCSKIGNIHNSEGFGMSQTEAAACGVPIMATDYSAMSDVVRKLGGIPLKEGFRYTEMETGCIRVHPDKEDFVNKLIEFTNLTSEDRQCLRERTQSLYLKNYSSWQKTTNQWIKAIDSIPPRNLWNSPIKIHNPEPLTAQVNNMDNTEYARWLICNVLGMPEKLNTFFHTRLIRDLNYGAASTGMNGMYANEDSALIFGRPNYKKFGRQEAYQEMVNICNNRNSWEVKRDENTLSGTL